MVLGYIGGAICAFRAALMRLRQLTSPVIKIVSRMINATVCTLCGFLLLWCFWMKRSELHGKWNLSVIHDDLGDDSYVPVSVLVPFGETADTLSHTDFNWTINDNNRNIIERLAKIAQVNGWLCPTIDVC